jgi:hypothetical protein
MRSSYGLVCVCLLGFCLLSACAVPSASTENTVTGRIQSIPEAWSSHTIYVYAAQYSGNDAGQGYFVLEPDLHPHAQVTRNGGFQITDLPDGTFILLAGPGAEQALQLVNSSGETVILRDAAGQGLDLGDVFVLN